MTARTYTDAVGAMREWINGRTTDLVGLNHPLQMGAHLKRIGGGEPAVYALIEENFTLRSEDSGENPDMMAGLTAQVYGGTREAATAGAVALAEALSTDLAGGAVTSTAIIMAVDNIEGPQWIPDNDQPRLLLNWTVRMRPA